MAQFLAGLGQSLGMAGPGGVAGGIGNTFGNMLMGPGGQMPNAGYQVAQQPQSYYQAPQLPGQSSPSPQAPNAYSTIPTGGAGWQNTPGNQYLIQQYA